MTNTRPLPPEVFDAEYAERFWSQVDRSGECWLWRGASKGDGYGTFQIGRKWYLAHRVALALDSGELPPVGADALHACRTPPCVRPSHLRWGTAQDNAADRHRDGTFHRKPRTGQKASSVTRVVPFRLPYADEERLQACAVAEGRTVSALLRELVEQYLAAQ